MKLANINHRAAVVVDGGAIDLEQSTDGRFGPDVQSLYDRWDDVVAAVSHLDTSAAVPFDAAALGSPVPSPRQVFAIGLNYADHVTEAGLELPAVPATFTKFPSSLSGPFDDIAVRGDTVDWEVELVAVIGRRADAVDEADGWRHVAGVTVGQDISDRTLQFAAGGQFSLGKSHRGFGPIGPWLVTPDEFDDPDNLALGCSLDGEVVQDSRTNNLVFSVPRLVAELSAVCPLWPGDIIFTGTPAGVGIGRVPPRFLRPGEVLESWIEGVGTIRNHIV